MLGGQIFLVNESAPNPWKIFSISDKFSYYQEYIFEKELIWLNPQLSVIFLVTENPARIDIIVSVYTNIQYAIGFKQLYSVW